MTDPKQFRFKMILTKAGVSDITDTGFKLTMLNLDGTPTSTTMTLVPQDGVMNHVDLRNGELLTLYTEVFLKPGVGNA